MLENTTYITDYSNVTISQRIPDYSNVTIYWKIMYLCQVIVMLLFAGNVYIADYSNITMISRRIPHITDYSNVTIYWNIYCGL